MATMIVKQEIEASPELVVGLLSDYAKKTADASFSYPAGSFIALTPDVLAAVSGVADMPSLVLMSGKGFALGAVAIQKQDGDITAVYLADPQVVGFWVPNKVAG